MDNLKEKFMQAFSWYAEGGDLNGHSYVFHDPTQNIYAINSVDDSQKRYPALITLMARIEGEYVIIEADNTDKPLVDRLIDAGIPREKIIKYYAGEALPEGLKQPADLSLP